MNILQTLGNYLTSFGKKQRVIITSGGPGNSYNQKKGMPRQSRGYVEEGYSQNNVVYRCVDIIANGIASVPIVVYKNDKPVESHPLQDLLDQPNPLMSYADMVKQFVGWHRIVGNAWLEAITDGGGLPKELWVWQPYNMQVLTGSENFSPIPRGYLFDNNKSKVFWEVDKLEGTSDMLLWKTFNPNSHWTGLSPLSAAAWAVDQHNSASDWNKNLLNNDASPSGALTIETELTDGQYSRLKANIDEQYTGSKNAKRPFLLENGMSWQQFALSPKDMDWLEGKNLSATDISGTYGVPTQVIPIPGSQTFANYEQARLALWEDTILPLLGDFLGTVSAFLFKYYPDGDQLELRPQLDDVAALVTRRKERFEIANASTFLSMNEKREMTGYEPKTSDPTEDPHDQILVTSSLIPLSFDLSDKPDDKPTIDEEDKPDDKPTIDEEGEEEGEDGDDKKPKPKPKDEDEDAPPKDEDGKKHLMSLGLDEKVAEKWMEAIRYV